MVKLSGVVGAIAVVPAVAAIALRRHLPLPAELLLWHVAGSGFAVAGAASEHLARHTTWLLGKTARGAFRPLQLAALWPYHAGLRAKLALQRRLSSEHVWDAVAPGLYIGGWPSEAALVPAVGAAVLDVTCELPLQVAPPAYKALPVWDTHGPTVAQMREGVAWARAQRAMGRPVLVHCAHGHGRSATVLAAILIEEGLAPGPAEAEALMRAARPRVKLNSRQRAALLAWAGARGKAL